MIDTDKYEGHTPAPWVCGSEEGLGIWKGLFNGVCATPDNYGKKGYEERPIARMHITEGTAESDFNRMMGDKQLIADAPLLLAEVLRLQEVAYLRICMIGERDKEIGRLLEDITRLEQIVRTQKELIE